METSEAATLFATLGAPTRVSLLRALLAAGPSGRSAGDIARGLGVPSSTLSFHLRALEGAGLVAATRQGRHLIYAAQVARLRALVAFLVDACCDGDPGRCGDLARLFDDHRHDPTTHAATPTGRPPMATEHAAHTVLFLCTRNSARSVMAEAILNEIGGGRFRALSGGPDPSPTGPMPEVLAKLRAMGHDVSGLRSKDWRELRDAEPDFVITLCDTLDGQECPEFGGTPITAAWPLPDPAKFAGSEAERQTMLNELYAALHRRMAILAALPLASLDRISLRARVEEIGRPRLEPATTAAAPGTAAAR